MACLQNKGSAFQSHLYAKIVPKMLLKMWDTTTFNIQLSLPPSEFQIVIASLNRTSHRLLWWCTKYWDQSCQHLPPEIPLYFSLVRSMVVKQVKDTKIPWYSNTLLNNDWIDIEWVLNTQWHKGFISLKAAPSTHTHARPAPAPSFYDGPETMDHPTLNWSWYNQC